MIDESSHRVSQDEREQAIVALRDQLLDGRLTLEEFSERVGLALRAVVGRDLDALQADLPREHPRPSRQDASRRKRIRFTGAVLAHVVRRGRLLLGRRTVVVSVLSDVDFDLRDASVEVPKTFVTVLVLVGNVDVYVPEGIDVDVGGVAVVGHRRDWGSATGAPGVPTLRVRALTFFGTVDVWRVPREASGDYGSIVRQLQRASRAAGREAELPPAGERAV